MGPAFSDEMTIGRCKIALLYYKIQQTMKQKLIHSNVATFFYYYNVAICLLNTDIFHNGDYLHNTLPRRVCIVRILPQNNSTPKVLNVNT